MMKINIFLAFFVCIFLTYSFNITSVSLLKAVYSAELQGSVMGGTKLIFIGSGFSTIAS